MALRSLRKIFLDSKIDKRLLKRFISQGGREIIYSYKFSKVNILRKRRAGAWSQEKACLNFSQAEGNIKAVVVTKLWVPVLQYTSLYVQMLQPSSHVSVGTDAQHKF